MLGSLYRNDNGVGFKVTMILDNGVIELSRLGNNEKFYLTPELIRDNLVLLLTGEES
jgi:hypothetical protein